MSSATQSDPFSARRIVVDTSALLAILFHEPERDAFIRILLDCEPVISIVTLTELCAVTRGRLGTAGLNEVDKQLADYAFEVAAVDTADWPLLRQAMLDFGKGRRRPPAVLNFGDLFPYALAKRLGLPLLYKGGDFARTDVVAASP
jgi:ribonuclease VapC